MKSKVNLKKILKISGNVILALLIALIIYLVVEIVIAFVIKKPPCIFNHYIFVVLTDSMEDTIMVGEVVFVKRTSFSNVNVGDIITFIDINPSDAVYGQYITHRVVGIATNGTLITQGDNNIVADTYRVNESNFIGIMDHHSRFLGSIVTFFSGNSNIVFVIVSIVLVAIICIETKNFLILKEAAKKEEEKEKLKQQIMQEINKGEKEE